PRRARRPARRPRRREPPGEEGGRFSTGGSLPECADRIDRSEVFARRPPQGRRPVDSEALAPSWSPPSSARRTVNVDPSPGRERTLICPPLATTLRLEIGRASRRVSV